MRFCSRCLYPENHPLNITFDEQGVCSGCRVHEEKDELDWDVRGEKLRSLLDSYRSDSETVYDCIIPVSGARDSYFIVHTVKNVYGMTPLLVTYNQQYNTHTGIRNLAYLKTLFDCDCLTMTINPLALKKLTRATLATMGSMYWHCLAGQSVFPVQIAVRMKIPLIVWGVHQGCDQVGMFSHLDEVEMTRKYRKEHDLMGYEIEDLLALHPELSEREYSQFAYPHDKDIEAVGVRGIYLSNFIRWDTKAQHEEMIELYGYETQAQQRTFDAYNDVDSFHYSGVHDYLKALKHGYGKAVDHASREIRLARMTRADAVARCSEITAKLPHDLPLFLDWIDMSEAEFLACVEPFRNLDCWQRNSSGEWELSPSYFREMSAAGDSGVALSIREACEFDENSLREPVQEGAANDSAGYHMFARGIVD